MSAPFSEKYGLSGIPREQGGEGGDRGRTIAIPLGHKLALGQRVEIPCQDLIHVQPHASKVPEHQQPHSISIHPCSLVEQSPSVDSGQETIKLGPAGERGHIHLSDLDVISPLVKVRLDERVARDGFPSIGPKDELRVSERLSGEEGGEGGGVSSAKGDQVRTPVSVVGERFKRDVGKGLDR